MWFDDSDFLLELGWWVRQRLAQDHTQRPQMHAYGYDYYGPADYDYDYYGPADCVGVCGS